MINKRRLSYTRFCLYSAVLIILFLPLQSVQAQDFFETLYDVPIMEGLSEIPERSMSFDKPSGRIAESVAYTRNLSPTTIRSFYRDTLPALGWNWDEAGFYLRGQEKLVVSFEGYEGGVFVKFVLTPK